MLLPNGEGAPLGGGTQTSAEAKAWVNAEPARLVWRRGSAQSPGAAFGSKKPEIKKHMPHRLSAKRNEGRERVTTPARL